MQSTVVKISKDRNKKVNVQANKKLTKLKTHCVFSGVWRFICSLYLLMTVTNCSSKVPVVLMLSWYFSGADLVLSVWWWERRPKNWAPLRRVSEGECEDQPRQCVRQCVPSVRTRCCPKWEVLSCAPVQAKEQLEAVAVVPHWCHAHSHPAEDGTVETDSPKKKAGSNFVSLALYCALSSVSHLTTFWAVIWNFFYLNALTFFANKII